MLKLTPKQEKFCKNIVSGMDGKAAYVSAYDAENMNDNTIYREANKLLTRDDITARIKELNKPLENYAINTAISVRKERVNFILERIEICKLKEDENSIIRYTDMLNKIDNLYKEEINGIKPENTLANMDTSTLEKLVNIS